MARRERIDLGDGAWIEWHPGAFADFDLETIVAEAKPRAADVVIFGKRVLQPRLVAWQADPECGYTYSGQHLEPERWTPSVLALRSEVEEAARETFNSVLINLYRDGSDSVGWHSDAEPCFGLAPVIASVSLGDARRFRFKRVRDGRSGEVPLGEGDLLIMGGTMQRYWKHAVEKTRRRVGRRLNLTFRRFLPESA